MNTLDSLTNKLPADTGVLLCGHGSRAPDYQQGLKELCQKVGEKLGSKISYGFLEHASPDIHLALNTLVQQGVTTIYAIPCLLFSATHAQNDIPSILKQYQQAHPHINIHTSDELGKHELMLDALQVRIQESLSLLETSVPQHHPSKNTALTNTLLIVISKGTSVSQANQKTQRITQTVSDRLGISHSTTLYSGPNFPSIEESLRELSTPEVKNIIVAPYFLFGGKITQRIYRDIDFLAKKNPSINFHISHCLGTQPAMVNAVIAQLNQLNQLSRNKK